MGDGVSFGDSGRSLVVRLQYSSHDAVGAGGLRHTAAISLLALVARRSASGASEIDCAGAVHELASVGNYVIIITHLAAAARRQLRSLRRVYHVLVLSCRIN